jgi:SNF2 family DNA or RNA helicase
MLRDYQLELANKGLEILKANHIVYYSIEMRVGKTLIALKTAEMIGAKKVLFLTKKKAIGSITKDFIKANFSFGCHITNYEQIDKLKPEWDLIIADEAHCLGAYPKKAQRTEKLRNLVGKNYLILLSGTPTPESYSQLYHQFWISDYTPFVQSNFYKWAHEFVKIKLQKISSGMTINNYDDADIAKIEYLTKKYFVSYTQQEAGFKQYEIIEEIKEIEIDPRINELVKMILKDKMYIFKNGQEIICDSAVKVQSKIHQIFSGTVKTQDGDYRILDNSKAEFIKNNYKDKKIAIFYKFIAEGITLKQILTNWTEDPEEFNSRNDKVFLSQVQSGSMGVNLATADCLIFYNIDFSATQYWQARARIQNLEREEPAKIHWLFSKGGIEEKILKAVRKKKDYTNYYFKKDYGLN